MYIQFEHLDNESIPWVEIRGVKGARRVLWLEIRQNYATKLHRRFRFRKKNSFENQFSTRARN